MVENIVFHYTPFTTGKSILENCELWCSSLHSMEDKDEFQFGSQNVLQTVRKAGLHQETVDRLESCFKAFSTHTDDPLKSGYQYITSFTVLHDHMGQWKEYADGGNGICLGFKKGEMRGSPGQSTAFVPVRYGESALAFVADATITELKDAGRNKQRLKQACLNAVFRCACIKKETYSAEEEDRLVLWPVIGAEAKWKVELNRTTKNPFIRMDFDSSVIASIRLGPRLSDANAAVIQSLAASSFGLTCDKAEANMRS